jgi:hypothetical protein
MSQRLVGPGVFSNLAESVAPAISDPQKFRNAIAIMRRVAKAAQERYPTWKEQHAHSLSAVVRFVENNDSFLASIKKRVDSMLGDYGRGASSTKMKEYILGDSEHMIHKGIYDIQYELACMKLPELENGETNGKSVYRITVLFTASNEISAKLGAFLDSIGVPRLDFIEGVETLREFFMAKSAVNGDISEHKQRLTETFKSLIDGYIEFHFAGQPMAESVMK